MHVCQKCPLKIFINFTSNKKREEKKKIYSQVTAADLGVTLSKLGSKEVSATTYNDQG